MSKDIQPDLLVKLSCAVTQAIAESPEAMTVIEEVKTGGIKGSALMGLAFKLDDLISVAQYLGTEYNHAPTPTNFGTDTLENSQWPAGIKWE